MMKSVFALGVLATIFSIQAFADEPAAKATTSSDYNSKAVRWAPGNFTGEKREIEQPNTQVRVGVGAFSNSGSEGEGLHLSGSYKENGIVTQSNGTELGAITNGGRRSDGSLCEFTDEEREKNTDAYKACKPDGSRYERGVNLFSSPGLRARVDLNTRQGQADRSEVTGTIGSVYRLKGTLPGGSLTGDVNFLNLGATIQDNRKLRTTELGATLSLASASGHAATTIYRSRACNEKELTSWDKSKGDCFVTTLKLPLEVHAGMTLIDSTMGYARNREQTAAAAWTPLRGELGVAVGYGDHFNLRNTLRFNPYTGLPGGSSSGLENELAIEKLLPFDSKLAWTHIRQSSEGSPRENTSLFGEHNYNSRVVTNLFSLVIPFDKYLTDKQAQASGTTTKVEDNKDRKPAVIEQPKPAAVEAPKPAAVEAPKSQNPAPADSSARPADVKPTTTVPDASDDEEPAPVIPADEPSAKPLR